MVRADPPATMVELVDGLVTTGRAGVGVLPGDDVARAGRHRHGHVDTLVIGAGSAGRQAAVEARGRAPCAAGRRAALARRPATAATSWTVNRRRLGRASPPSRGRVEATLTNDDRLGIYDDGYVLCYQRDGALSRSTMCVPPRWCSPPARTSGRSRSSATTDPASCSPRPPVPTSNASACSSVSASSSSPRITQATTPRTRWARTGPDRRDRRCRRGRASERASPPAASRCSQRAGGRHRGRPLAARGHDPRRRRPPLDASRRRARGHGGWNPTVQLGRGMGMDSGTTTRGRASCTTGPVRRGSTSWARRPARDSRRSPDLVSRRRRSRGTSSTSAGLDRRRRARAVAGDLRSPST